MASVSRARRPVARATVVRRSSLPLAVVLCLTAACNHSTSSMATSGAAPSSSMSATAPSPDPRVGLKAGLMDAQEAVWNLRVVSRTQPSAKFVGITNSDLAFTGPLRRFRATTTAIRSGTSRIQRQPSLKTAYYCPASQSDVSVYKNLLFVSGEGLTGRLDCGGRA